MAEINPANSATQPKPANRFLKKIKKYLYLALTLFILLVGVYVYWSFFFTYSEGSRAGLLQKFSKKGNVFKTYEGEMILSSVQSNKNVAIASDKFVFSVADKAVALQLDSLQGKNVIVHYTEKNNSLPWRGETKYIVSSAKLSN